MTTSPTAARTAARPAALAALAAAALLTAAGCSAPHRTGPETDGYIYGTRTGPIADPVSAGPDGRSLAATTTIGACDLPPRLSAVETDTAVRLTVRITSRVRPGAVCAADARLARAETQLRRPLGSRALVDASTGRRLRAGALPGGAPSTR